MDLSQGKVATVSSGVRSEDRRVHTDDCGQIHSSIRSSDIVPTIRPAAPRSTKATFRDTAGGVRDHTDERPEKEHYSGK